jgi:hypothetical protein
MRFPMSLSPTWRWLLAVLFPDPKATVALIEADVRRRDERIYVVWGEGPAPYAALCAAFLAPASIRFF